MNVGRIIMELFKKNRSQSNPAKIISVSRVIIGKYERNEAIPSIEVAKKIADALRVSLDFLVGEGQNSSFDKRTLEIINDIESLEPKTKEKLYFIVNAVIRDSKTRQAYAI